MLPPANLLGILSALASAFVWGSADFSGGFASRKNNPFQVLVLSSLSGIVVLLVLAALWRETFPSLRSVLWAMLAGILGALGLAAFYRGLSLGYTAIVAPTGGVIGAALPVGFSILTEGTPGAARLAGFALAFLGIWLVSQTKDEGNSVSRRGFLLACLAGAAFGGFFIVLGQVEPGYVFTPLVAARSMSFVTALFLVWLNQLPLPSLTSNPIAWLAGMLDAGGNIFYLLARQFTRLDIAAVLASLYPAITVLLALVILKEKVTRRQWGGIGVCLAAIAFITA
jgi:drug/metabolite transporter (DMT)-like permease